MYRSACTLGLAVGLGALMSGTALGEGLFDNLEGSFGEGGFDRYVPPITNPVQNETPFITTEIKPFYAYHSIPEDFVTDGGSVQVVGLQARIALTERLAFIATTDGYTWIDFDETLPDDSGLNDIAAGFKYAIVNQPDEGEIVSLGLRYVAPVGGLETAGLELNGTGAGYLNPFVTGAKLWDKTQVQGSLGAQIALSDDNWSFIHASGHVDHEIAPNLFPALEFNAMIPVDGGDQITSGPLDSLTGADIVDIGADDPQPILTIGGGVRYRVSDNAIFGVGADYNVLEDEDHVYGWRIITDLVLHF